MSLKVPVIDYHVRNDSGNSEDVPHGHRALKQWYPEEFHRPVTETFAYPSRFEPPAPTDSPSGLFFDGQPENVTGPRFIRKTNHDQILIFTDGACLFNGQPRAAAGWGFVFGPPGTNIDGQTYDGTCCARLEVEGPTGLFAIQSSNRAELRAVIAALQFRAWQAEGWTELVIATDSEYVVNGATQWAHHWIKNGWLSARHLPVLNRDLWELLLKEVRRKGDCGMEILFWHIPRQWNGLADNKAKEAAKKDDIQEFSKIYGVMV